MERNAGYDTEALEKKLSPDERLRFHQEHSAPRMTELETWLKAQFGERRVEPNSSLGKAIKYMQRHWLKLTRFLQIPGAPSTTTSVRECSSA